MGLKVLTRRLYTRLVRALLRGNRDQQAKTHLEVERKFHLTGEEFLVLPERLLARHYQLDGTATMSDTFLPSAVEGDMVRLRVETMNGKTTRLITLKTWVMVGGDRERKEEEGEVGAIALAAIVFLGWLLSGFRLLGFSKTRQLYSQANGLAVVVSLDTVNGLGEHSGHYMEIEVLVPIGQDVQPARERIREIVRHLLDEDREFVKLSYMDMLKSTSTR